jgi:tetratricopeptide (TPR) repeat protein
MSRIEEASAAWQRSHELYRQLVERRPESFDYRHALGLSEMSGGVLHRLGKRYEESTKLLDHARQIFEALVVANPQLQAYREDLVTTELELSYSLLGLGRATDALAAAEQSLENIERVLAVEPNAGRRSLQVNTLSQIAKLRTMEGRTRDALAILRRARDIEEEAVRAEPESIYHRSTLARTLASLGRAAASIGAREEALAAFRRAKEEIDGLVAHYPSQLYSQACYVALQMPLVPQGEREAVALRAVELLRRAVGGGYGSRAEFESDTDLDPLRGRADFAEVMESVPAK